MNRLHIRTAAGFRLLMVFASLMLATAIACTPSEAELLQGILQNVDAVNGEITIVTKDGKTVTLKIATAAPVETEGATSALETLEPGASVEVEVNGDGRVAQHIEARQAKVEGVIVEIKGNEVTVESERGRRRTVLVTDRTRIKLEDDFPGTLADLRVGAEVEVKFDPDNGVAFKIDAEEEEAEIEGVVVQIEGDKVTIETERGRRLTVIVGDRTQFELEDDFPGSLADLQVGVGVETKFDPFTRRAFKIEVKEEEKNREKAEIEGVILGIEGNKITVETESGRSRALTVTDRTRIKLEEDFSGTLADVQVGAEVEVHFDQDTDVALEIELKD